MRSERDTAGRAGKRAILGGVGGKLVEPESERECCLRLELQIRDIQADAVAVAEVRLEGSLDEGRQAATVTARLTGTAIERRRFLRTRVYQRFPLFLRPFLFWIYGYVFRLGFLDGVEGLIFHTLQRFWFRFLVDAKIWELKRRLGSSD
jgi:hypothetical protein